MTQDWKLLEQAALPGTGQSVGAVPLPSSLTAAVPDADTREHQALLAAGSLSLMNRAGFVPHAATSVWPVASSETFAPLGERGRTVINHIIGANDETLLQHYLRLLDEAQPPRVIPHDCLVPLLDIARNDAQRTSIFHHAGERGRWLAERNPAWKKFLEAAPDEDVWALGTLTQRAVFFHELRAKDPAAARERLLASLKEESAKTLEQIVPGLKIGLSPEDEPLLLLLAKHKGLEVKRLARWLLLNLPVSELSQKAFELATSHLQLKQGVLGSKMLKVTLPQAHDSAWEDYNIVKSYYIFPGERASLLGQMVANVHPDRWLAHFEVDRKELLTLFRKTDHGPLLIAALAHAANRYAHADTTLAIIAANREGNDAEVEELLDRQDFGSHLSCEALQPELEAFLKKPSDTVGPRLFSVLVSAARTSPPWSLSFTQLVLRFMEKRKADSKLHAEQAMLAREVFFRALPPGAETLVQEYAQQQVAGSRMANYAFSEFEKLGERLATLAQMRASLTEAPAAN